MGAPDTGRIHQQGDLACASLQKKKMCQKGLRASAGGGVPAILLPQHPRT